MSSLLDKVLDSKDNPTVDNALSPKDDEAHRLPDGSVIYDSTISAINRIFELNPSLHKRVTPRGEQLYDGRTPVDIKNQSQMLRLLHGDWTPKTDWQVIFLQEKVMEIAPIYSFDCYEVTSYLLWDRDEAKLKRIKEWGKMEDENERTESTDPDNQVASL